jgi:hypothetical protein
MVKECRKCNEEKELTEFHKETANKDGLVSHCKSCRKVIHKEYRENNKKKLKAQSKEYRENNIEKIKTTDKEYYQDNIEKIKARSKEYRENNIEKIKEQRKKYCENNIGKIKARRKRYNENNIDKKKECDKKYRENNKEKIKEYQRIWIKNKKTTDPLYKISCAIKGRIRNCFKNSNHNKNSNIQDILGIPFQDFKDYIESKFESWMTWENYGNPKDGIYELNKTWDLDHIIPSSSAEIEQDVYDLNHYTNFQPLCSYNNRFIKKDNY